jgi:hypothetical protein
MTKFSKPPRYKNFKKSFQLYSIVTCTQTKGRMERFHKSPTMFEDASKNSTPYTPNMEVIFASETLGTTYRTTQRHISEDYCLKEQLFKYSIV